MNVVNGWVSPRYFYIIFHYPGGSFDWTPSELYWHSIQQGLLEGAISGLVISTVFTGFVFVVSRASCPFAISSRFIVKMFLMALLFWLVGGINGALLAVVLPQNILPLPITPVIPPKLDNARWFWVAGSIWGAYVGALVALVSGCTSFHRAWRKIKSKPTYNYLIAERLES